MHKIFFPVIVMALISIPSGAQDVRSDQRYGVVAERGVTARMRDGVILRADIYRPKSEGRFPVLLERTAYDKLSSSDIGYAAAAHGYVVVVQDTRGTFTSDGEFYPFRYEAQDGYDTVEWASGLPYSNGKVGMFGASYIGATQMQAAVAAPPHLSGIFPVLTGSDYHDGWTYQGGAYEQWFNQTWGFNLVRNTLLRRMNARTMTVHDILRLPLVDYPQISLDLPGAFSPAAVGSYYKDWLEHPSYDDYWRAFSIEERYNKIRVPAYHVGGVYDIFLRGTLRNYQGMRTQAATVEARNGQRLEIMMASHNRGGPKVGDLDFGPSAEFKEIDTMLRWYDYLLKGIDNGIQHEKAVKIFVMGRNEWRYEDEWPPRGAHTVQYFLHSSGKANSLNGDGVLSETAPQRERPDSFTYDPADPVQTQGGALCCVEKDLPGGPFDQRSAESRSDILVYTTPTFDREMELIGPVFVKLFASSSSVDTDFTAKLVDVWPGGYAQNLTDGIIRAQYRDSQEKSELMQPGTVYPFSIDLVSTSDTLLPGHRLRVEISSSNFPRFSRNLNTGESQLDSTHSVIAKNKIYHDSSHGSAVVVTVVPSVGNSAKGRPPSP